MTPRTLARKIRKFRAKPSQTTNLERALIARQMRTLDNAWYVSQKEHWLGWLGDYHGPGYYGRKNPKRSAEFVYNHINCSPMVLWLGEASGVPKKVVEKAKRAALRTKKNMGSQCSAIRKIIPWVLIEAQLQKSKS
ncbi:MAG: hypothetical protein ACRECC_12615 [Pseudolabrys sp.]|jgi:hypothetical protein